MGRRSIAVALSVATAVLAAACGQGAPSPATAVPGPTAAPARPPLDTEQESAPPVAHGVVPRRDPFKVPVRAPMDAGKAPALEGFRLVGVISGSTGSTALVEGPDGIGYILKPGDVLGTARVREIRRDAVRFALAVPRSAPPVDLTLRLETD